MPLLSLAIPHISIAFLFLSLPLLAMPSRFTTLRCFSSAMPSEAFPLQISSLQLNSLPPRHKSDHRVSIALHCPSSQRFSTRHISVASLRPSPHCPSVALPRKAPHHRGLSPLCCTVPLLGASSPYRTMLFLSVAKSLIAFPLLHLSGHC